MKTGKKKPEISDYMQVGQYLDVYLSFSKCSKLARIISIKDKEVEVNFDGMAKKHNEVDTFIFCYIIRFSKSIQLNSHLQGAIHRVNLSSFFLKSDYTGDDYKNGKTSRDYLKYSNETCVSVNLYNNTQKKYSKELATFMKT